MIMKKPKVNLYRYLAQHMNVKSDSRQSTNCGHKVVARNNDGEGKKISHILFFKVPVQGETS